MSASYLMHDDLNDDGVLKNKEHYYPPIIGFASKGCMRCPDFMQRDTRERING